MLDEFGRGMRDRPLQLVANFGTSEGLSEHLHSSLNRELAYVLEHGIHHQALIKMGVKQIKREELLDELFGVAPATVRYYKKDTVHA